MAGRVCTAPGVGQPPFSGLTSLNLQTESPEAELLEIESLVFLRDYSVTAIRYNEYS